LNRWNMFWNMLWTMLENMLGTRRNQQANRPSQFSLPDASGTDVSLEKILVRVCNEELDSPAAKVLWMDWLEGISTDTCYYCWNRGCWQFFTSPIRDFLQLLPSSPSSLHIVTKCYEVTHGKLSMVLIEYGPYGYEC
jgi:hypothetical protein